MKVLVRYLTKKRDGTTASRDEEIFCEALRLGRGTFNDVDLSSAGVLLREGAIYQRSGELFFEVEGQGGNISIGGKAKRSGKLQLGSIVTIGPYNISVISAPEGCDLAVSVELVRSVASSLDNLRRNSKTRLTDATVGKRLLSWVGAVVVLALFLIWPLVDNYYVSGTADVYDVTTNSRGELWPIAADIAWGTGKISGSHRFIGHNCSTCHEEAFVQVRDSVCTTCHKAMRHHVDSDGYYDMSELTEGACQSCHKEHQGAKTLARSDQSFCADCHGSIESVAPESKLDNATDFGKDHPEFRPTVVVNADLGRTERIRLDQDPLPGEDSNLKFPHAKHLNPKGLFVPGSQGLRKLGCSDCHQKVGYGFFPIKMETHCGDCHLLNFEPTVPTRVLPHEDYGTVVTALREFYSDLALRGGSKDQNAPDAVRRRRPGGTIINSEEKRVALNWADFKTEQTARRLFGRSGCGTCHEVSKIDDENVQYKIAPVMLTNRWLPKAFFDHSKHNVSDCTDCHSASASKHSKDILLPKVALCQNCHGGESAERRVPSTCISCHDFHMPHQGLMRLVVKNSTQ